MTDEWKEMKQVNNEWVIEFFEVVELKDNEVIITTHGEKVKVVPGKCQDCRFRIDRGLAFCDCRGEIPKKYLIKDSLCNLKNRKFVSVKAKNGI